MTDPETRYTELVDILQKKGTRLTSHRVALARLLSISEGHPNASTLYLKLKAQFPTISLATVYKTLSLLKENGEVLEIVLQGDSHFDGNKPYSHPHLVCSVCHQIYDADEPLITGLLEKEIEGKYSFKIQRHQIVYYGICQDCQNKTSSDGSDRKGIDSE